MTVALRFLFDEHVNVSACRTLRLYGIDAVHALEAELGGRPDTEVLRWSAAEARVVVTRNYQDFAPLAQAVASRGELFPGVLFLATSIHPADVGAHIRALTEWIASFEPGSNPVANSFAWLR